MRYYDKENETFVIDDGSRKKARVYKTFKGFVKALKGDLSNADLRGFEFSGIDLSKYDWKDALIDIEVLKEQKLYDDNYYKLVTSPSSYPEYIKNAIEIERPSRNSPNLSKHAEDALYLSEEYGRHFAFEASRKMPDMKAPNNLIGYISDLHLDFLVKQRFPDGATKNQIVKYIRGLIYKLFDNSPEIYECKYIVICGDVSASFELTKIFYGNLSSLISFGTQLIAILGNHELWDFPEDLSFRNVVQKYEDFFETLRFPPILLQNDLYVETADADREWISTRHIYRQEDLLKMTISEISELGEKSRTMIFGGLGFSGCNGECNASSGLYRSRITTEEDIELSLITQTLYLRLETALSNKRMIVATHMPMKDWSHSCSYQPEWFYIWGHTHRNELDAERHFFADNQVGYHKSEMQIKTFSISNIYNTFENYTDGIHEITAEEYRSYNVGINIRMRFSEPKDTESIFLLKNGGFHMFILRNSKNDLCLLSGGKRKKLREKRLENIYRALGVYGTSITNGMSQYRELMNAASSEVRRLGFSGRIHGCIIDVDYGHHLFINPLNGHIAAYYALDIVNKGFYKNPLSMIVALRGNEISDTQDCITSLGISPTSILLKEGTDISTYINPIGDTWHYAMSRVVFDIERISTHKTVRYWDEEGVRTFFRTA